MTNSRMRRRRCCRSRMVQDLGRCLRRYRMGYRQALQESELDLQDPRRGSTRVGYPTCIDQKGIDLTCSPYLIRHEIIAMHYAHEPQVYPVCFQANVSGSGSSVPAETVTFPDAYSSQSISDDFETLDVHDNKADKASFVPPGPAVAVLGPGSAAPSSQPSASASAIATSASSDVPAASQSGDDNVPAPSASSVAAAPQASEGPSSVVEPVVESSSTVAESAQASSPAVSEPAGDQNQGGASQGSSPSPVSQGSAASGSSTSGRGRNRPHRQGHPR